MASPGNRHSANCIGALSLPMFLVSVQSYRDELTIKCVTQVGVCSSTEQGFHRQSECGESEARFTKYLILILS